VLAQYPEQYIGLEWRRGRLAGAEDVVRANQAEVLLLAYLLTGSGDGARVLARDAFLRTFRELPSNDPETDWRSEILGRLCGCYLQARYSAAEPQANSPTMLDRLSRPERLALVFGEVSGVGLPGLNRLLARDGIPVTVDMDVLRQRVRQSLGLSGSETLRSALLGATLDRPRADLWPLVETMLAEDRRQRQRSHRTRAALAAAALLLVALVTTAVMLADAMMNASGGAPPVDAPTAIPAASDMLFADLHEPATPTPEPPAPPVGDVTSSLYTSIHRNAEENGVSRTEFVVVDTHNQQLLDIGTPVAGGVWQGVRVSPDGGTLAVLHSEWTETGVIHRVSALDSSTFAERWQVEVGSFERDAGTGRLPVNVGLVAGTEHLYVWFIRNESPFPVEMRTLDLATGKTGQRQEFDLSDNQEQDELAQQGAHMVVHVAPDGSRLVVIAETWDMSMASGARSLCVIELQLPELETVGPEACVDQQESEVRFFWGELAMSVHANVLHGHALLGETRPAIYQFLDLDSNELSAIDLPFERHANRGDIHLARMLSNDGRLVYLIDTESGEVAIVNLVEQRLERHFRIDTGEFGSRFGTETEQLIFGSAHSLTHDGETLYLSARSNRNAVQGDAQHTTGVWTIDLYSWTLVDFISVRGQVFDIQSIPGSSDIVVRNWFYEDAGDQQSRSELIRIAREDGRHSTGDFPANMLERNNEWSLLSLSSLYRSQHGRTPSVDGVQPADIDNYTTLPRFEATLSEDAVSGVSTTVEVRVVHPVSGDVLAMTGGGVRFNPDSTVMAHLHRRDEPGRIVMLSSSEPGIYRGGVTLPSDGSWSIDVIVIEPDGRQVVSANAGFGAVAPALAGSDGQIYRFSLSTSPENPMLDEEVTLTLRIVNAETGQRLPSGVDFDVPQPALDGKTIAEMPERVDVSVAIPGDPRRYRLVWLDNVGRGRYEGTVDDLYAGTWRATIRLQIPGARRIETPGGTIEVASVP
jgi:hypothetical protein